MLYQGRMKNISIRISVDGESIGAFTLDASTTVHLIAHAKVNPGLTLPEFVHKLMKDAILGCDEYMSGIVVEDENGVLATAMKICSARELAALKISADPRN